MIDKKLKSTLIAVSFGVILFAALVNFDTLVSLLSRAVGIIFPILLGLLFAFVMNVPVAAIERLAQKAFVKCKHRPDGKALRLFSIIITLIFAVLILTLLLTAVIPEIIHTAKSIPVLLENHGPEWIDALNRMDIDTTALVEWLGSIDLRQLVDSLAGPAGNLLGSMASIATSTVTAVAQLLVGLVLAVYVLLERETLTRQCKKLLYAYMNSLTADRICEAARLIRLSYSKYLSGQCIEAVILGVLILAFFLVFHLPYASLVAMAAAICALIPYIGATISFAIAVLLTLLSAPEKTLICILVYLVIQFVETQFIYPHVVGGTVGLSPLWTMIAVLIGGELCGFVGVVFFIPLTAALYTLVRNFINGRLEEKGISHDKYSALP